MPASEYTLHVRRGGTGPTVVLIHGVAGSGAIWHRITPQLEQHFDVIRPDLLGYGFSPKPAITYDMTTHLEAIRRTLATQGVTGPVRLIGLSMGSLLALAYAARWPEAIDSVVCIGLPYYHSKAEARERLKISPWTNLAIHHPAFARLAIPLTWGVGRTAPVHQVKEHLPRHAEAYRGEVARESLMASYRAFSSSLHECMINFRLDDYIDQVRCPLLFIHGDTDLWTPSDKIAALAARLPRARLAIVPGPHNLAYFAPRTVLPVIEEFLANPEHSYKLARRKLG